MKETLLLLWRVGYLGHTYLVKGTLCPVARTLGDDSTVIRTEQSKPFGESHHCLSSLLHRNSSTSDRLVRVLEAAG
jgi:hypothetical protein